MTIWHKPRTVSNKIPKKNSNNVIVFGRIDNPKKL